MKKPNIPAAYLGKRFIRVEGKSKSSLYHLFLKQGKEIYHKNIRKVHIGQTYLAFKDAMPTYPERITDERAIEFSDKEIAKFEALDMAALEQSRSRNEQIRINKSIAEKSKSKIIKDIRNQLEDITNGMSWDEARFFFDKLFMDTITKTKRYKQK